MYITVNVIISKQAYSGVGQSIPAYRLPLCVVSFPVFPLLRLYSFTPVGWITSSTLALGQGRQRAH
jgi:hypothetical protein